MTTVAFKDGIMSCDGQSTLGDMTFFKSVNKIFKHKDHVYGLCGSVNEMLILKDCILNNRIPPEELDVSGLLMTKKKNYFISVTCGRIVKDPSVGSLAAVGSGGGFALAAMKAGASAKEAVKIACELDVYSGGRVREVYL